jgi:DNA-binding NtrC family response regulator
MQKIEILVVDDEEEMRVSYQKLLTRAGYSVQSASKCVQWQGSACFT